MLNKIKEFLGINTPIIQGETLDIQVGVFEGKLHVKLSRKVDIITFDKMQLSQLLAAIASQAVNVK